MQSLFARFKGKRLNDTDPFLSYTFTEQEGVSEFDCAWTITTDDFQGIWNNADLDSFKCFLGAGRGAETGEVPARWNRVFARMDENNDGVISFDEFDRAVRAQTEKDGALVAGVDFEDGFVTDANGWMDLESPTEPADYYIKAENEFATFLSQTDRDFDFVRSVVAASETGDQEVSKEQWDRFGDIWGAVEQGEHPWKYLHFDDLSHKSCPMRLEGGNSNHAHHIMDGFAMGSFGICPFCGADVCLFDNDESEYSDDVPTLDASLVNALAADLDRIRTDH